MEAKSTNKEETTFMRNKWKAKIREEMREDTNRMMEKVNSAPALKDVEAPEEIHTKLMQQIREYEASKNSVDERLTSEERELIKLGMVYKRTRNVYRYAIVAAAVITMLAVGITSVGGPKKVVEIVRQMVSERERTKVNIDKDRIDDVQAKGEYETYLEIEDVFKASTVYMLYKPAGMKFVESDIDEELQNARLNYEGENDQALLYNMWFNYRSTSTGVDVEDKLLQDYVIDVDGHEVLVKQYQVEDGSVSRWRAEFEHQKVQYFIVMNGLNQKEVEKIVKNLHFY